MRISTKLTSATAAMFLIVGGVGTLGLERLRELAHMSVVAEAQNVATAIATMASFDQDSATYQDIMDFMAQRQNRDLEIIDRNFTVMADVDKAGVGEVIEEGATPGRCGANATGWPAAYHERTGDCAHAGNAPDCSTGVRQQAPDRCSPHV
ncbi:hypothetical protein ACHMW6_14355 [Pseudoduganella sp. UC29_106]|uniref:hypothetical protein n=1 Tax=Pseudoduganella sp. UC29_106 TaxID=3374553 RepID=UPI003757808C